MITTLVLIGLTGTISLLVYSYRSEVKQVETEALESGMNLVQRSGQMFMVSTKKFNEQFEASATPEEKARVTADWIRTIVAVDQAVINDFGEAHSRVRLLGSKDLTGHAPMGGKDTQVNLTFESDALKAFAAGSKDPIIKQDDKSGILRIALPLHSSMHAGCANCHQVPVDKVELLGGLAAYVPIKQKLIDAKYHAFKEGMMLTGIFLGLIGVFYLLVSKRILKPINELRIRTQDLADGSGDLTHKVPLRRDDEIGELAGNLNRFMEKLHSIFTEISDVTINLREVADTSSSASGKTAANMDRQRNQTQTVIASINEMEATVSDMAHSTAEAATTVQQADAEAKDGIKRVEEMSRELESLSSTLSSAEDVVQRLASDSDNIGSILDVIRNIAEQTNLLALNAAIEAARAGEQGRGFAVVADEVRTLAQRTQQSIQQIESMIERLQSASSEAAAVMKEGHQSGAHTAKRSQELTEALYAVIHTFSVITEKNLQIASAAEQQSSSMQEFQRNIHDINLLSQETAEQANEASQVSTTLTQVTGQLTALIGKFKT
jgi:methyl-accepting chemotaxis protein